MKYNDKNQAWKQNLCTSYQRERKRI